MNELQLIEPTVALAEKGCAPLRAISGWPLLPLCQLEGAGAHGLLASLIQGSVLHRQCVFTALALGLLDSPERFIERARGGLACATSWSGLLREAGLLLITTPARTILKAVCPDAPRGLLGALAKIGPDPLSGEVSYEKLVAFLRTAPGVRRRVLAHGGHIDDLRLAVAESLDEALLPIANRVRTAERLAQVNDLASLLREFATTMTNAEIAKALSDLKPSTPLADAFKRLLFRLEGFEAPFTADPVYARLITSGEDLRRMGIKYRNCLGERHAVEAAAGKTIYFEWMEPPGAIVEVHAVGEFYLLGQIHGTGNVRPPEALRANVRAEFEKLSPKVLVRSEVPERFQAAKRLFRHFPFEDFDLDDLVDG